MTYSHVAALNVLFLPKNSRTGFFKSFLRTARERCGWRVRVLCPVGGERVWREAVGAQGGCIALPDFAASTGWESDPAKCEEVDGFIAECERAGGASAGRIILAGERELGAAFRCRISIGFMTGLHGACWLTTGSPVASFGACSPLRAKPLLPRNQIS